MTTISTTYQPWEYRVLDKGYSIGDTARLLERTEDEVELKLRAYHDTSLDRWYQRKRIDAAPDTVRRFLAIGYVIWRDEFKHVIERGEVEREVYQVLDECFRHFDRTKVPEGKCPENGFFDHFKFWYKRRLKDLEIGRARPKRHRSANKTDEEKQRIQEEKVQKIDKFAFVEKSNDNFTVWAGRLMQAALPRLKSRMRNVIIMRYLKRMDLGKIAEKLDISPKTLKNNYSEPKIINAVTEAVQNMILDLPQESLDTIICYLHYNCYFNEAELATLLKIPKPKVYISLERAGITMAKGLGFDQVAKLLG